MIKKLQITNYKFLLAGALFLLVLMPLLSFAQWDGLVPCATKKNPVPCGFTDILFLVNKVIDFIFVSLALPLGAVMIAYAGFLMVMPGGESASSRTKAKHILTNTVIGLVIAGAAWLIVHVILEVLGFDGSWIGF